MERRYREHSEGSKKCNYTRSFPPKIISACWEIQSETASEAMKLERAVKRLSKDLKKILIAEPQRVVFYESGTVQYRAYITTTFNLQ